VEFLSISVKDEMEKHELSIKIEVLTKMRDEFLDYKDEF